MSRIFSGSASCPPPRSRRNSRPGSSRLAGWALTSWHSFDRCPPLADLHAAIVSAIATLKGPRHGGANEDVLSMLLEIEDPARAEAFVESRLGARSGLSKHERANPKARMPGFGHRVYKVDDARARVLRGMAKSMAEATGRERLFVGALGRRFNVQGVRLTCGLRAPPRIWTFLSRLPASERQLGEVVGIVAERGEDRQGSGLTEAAQGGHAHDLRKLGDGGVIERARP